MVNPIIVMKLSYIGNKKVKIKSANSYNCKLIMPKIHNVESLPKDIYFGVRYNEKIKPNEIEIIGYLLLGKKNILKGKI